MLQTLLKIGEWQSQGKSEWDRFLERPNIQYEDKQGNKITNYVLPIIFDLDDDEVIVERENLREFRETDVEDLKTLKIQGGNNKAIYASVPSNKLIQLYKTFFGKEGDNGGGEKELLEAIKKIDTSILTEKFSSILDEISKLKSKVLAELQYYNDNKDEYKVDFKSIQKKLELLRSENVVLVFLMIKSVKHGFSKPVEFSKIDDYLSFLKKKFFSNSNENQIEGFNKHEKLCYASGKKESEVSVMDLTRRDSLNKMFGAKTSFNYISNFKQINSNLNYQVSSKNKEFLDFASNYLLNENKPIYIAGIRHCVVPEFLSSSQVDVDMALSNIYMKSDLIFSYKSIDNFNREIKAWTDEPFWINFLALDYPADKKYLKTQSVIKDVSIFHFESVLNEMIVVDESFQKLKGVDWNWVKGESTLNLHTFYKLFPVKESNKNIAYEVFKSIFEKRKIQINNLYESFSELILCYYYKRFKGYTNQKEPNKENYLKTSIIKIVFKYLAFFQVLKNLNLIDMEEQVNEQVQNKEITNKYDRAIHDFFNKMKLNQDQQAMFYLGRMLNQVEFIQKGKKKTVIEKVNFNGMDYSDLLRLRNSLVEKAKQYGKVSKVAYLDGKFCEMFNLNKWKESPMNSQEAVFFLLTGYSFRFTSDDVEKLEKIEDDKL